MCRILAAGLHLTHPSQLSDGHDQDGGHRLQLGQPPEDGDQAECEAGGGRAVRDGENGLGGLEGNIPQLDGDQLQPGEVPA